MNPSVATGGRVPAVTVAAADLAELILAVHGVATGIPRRLRHQHDNVIDIVAATVSDVRPEIARRRYGLGASPTAAFAVSQRGHDVDVIIEHADGIARATFHTDTFETHWPARLAEYTLRALLALDIDATLS
ncbi:hypothetical protein NONO_c54290 [Nocardia nova SH22a]|uniref:Uncharacterized protein n=1 Tax=Nocardia nova SH22a TaxID=1415166 RepID=W5TM41_9NOCA|nr:hypothetical protein [Nocardia nova]AHH20209.1 hypothetical protein NONO_c54290 [Nocardia nova SH22a]